jgi:outer membrane protein assembly factor BamE (lipoprotein component of BamABCDE complex)
MKKSRIIWILVLIVSLLISGCSKEDEVIVDKEETIGVETTAELDPIDRFNQSLEVAKNIESMRQVVDIVMKIEFDETIIQNDQTGLAAMVMAIMSNIQMRVDLQMEGINNEDPDDMSDFKASGNIEVRYGEEQQKLNVYFDNQKAYTELPNQGLVYESIDAANATISSSKLNFNNFLMNQYDEEKIIAESVDIEFEGTTYQTVKFSYENSLEKIIKFFKDDVSLYELTGIDGETDLKGFEFEDLIYSIYVNDDNEIIRIEMGFKVIPENPERMLGMKSINYFIGTWLLDLNDVQVELPDLSYATEKIKKN